MQKGSFSKALLCWWCILEEVGTWLQENEYKIAPYPWGWEQ